MEKKFFKYCCKYDKENNYYKSIVTGKEKILYKEFNYGVEHIL